MKLQNTTNITDERLRQIIEFVKPNHLPTSTFDIRVTNSSTLYSGAIYPDGYHRSDRPHIIVRITKNENEFPHMEDNTRTTKAVVEKYQKYNDKKGRFETWRRVIYEKLPKSQHKKVGGYIDSLILTREEALVHTLAHELRHLWQKNHHKTKRGKVWGARGHYSDRDADAYAIRKMREWRRRNTPKQVFPDDKILGL